MIPASATDQYKHDVDPQGLIATLLGTPTDCIFYRQLDPMPRDLLAAIANQAKQHADTALEAAKIMGRLTWCARGESLEDGDISMIGVSVEFLIGLGIALQEVASESQYLAAHPKDLKAA